MNAALEITQSTDTKVLTQTYNRNFTALSARQATIRLQQRDFVDATAGAVVRYLPRIASVLEYDFFYCKTDSSVNTVTITAFGTETINGAATYVLAAQYDRVCIAANAGAWYIVHT
jgi:hypothetical protein